MHQSRSKRWPSCGDTIFGGGTRWEAHAMLDGGFRGHWFLAYAMGYKEAADIVVDSVLARNSAADRVGYPVLYLYRHYVEVMLKGVISQAERLSGKSAAYPNYPTGHEIGKLWRRCRPLLERAFPEEAKAETDAVEKCMGEFAKLDSGETFRYGEDKSGQTTIPNALHLDLEHLRDVMDGISGFFEGSYDALDELIQHQADFEADFA